MKLSQVFKAHTEPITGACVSNDGSLLASTAADKRVKVRRLLYIRAHTMSTYKLTHAAHSRASLQVFDVINFDMIHMLSLKFIPYLVEFVHQCSGVSARKGRVAVSEVRQLSF